MNNFKDFLKVYSTISNEFIDSFYKFFNDDYDEKKIYIDHILILQWLDIQKRYFVDTLKKNFIENIDY
jgi:hypothetical protein